MLTPADQRQVLQKANEVLGLIEAEWEKAASVCGAQLRLAILQKLRAEIRVIGTKASNKSSLKHLFDVH